MRGDAALCLYLRAVGYVQVPGKAHLAAYAAVAAYLRAASHACLRGDDGMRADLHIVGYLHQVVELGALPYDGGAYAGTVYGGAGAYFYVVFEDGIARVGYFW